VEPVLPDFHARYGATGKTYKYFLYNREARDPFKRHYYAWVRGNLHIAPMKEAARHLIGTHDFTSFCSAKTETANKVRTISRIDIEQNHDEIVITFTGNGFLYNMVRIMVGTLLEVGKGKRPAGEVRDILAAKDRRLAGKTAPAEGLYLWKVYYDES
jgi:tRNA pseudouridine38-40 synthase